jgi:TP901 family phage tail tape measure protein
LALVVKIGANLRDFERQMKRVTREISYLGSKLENTGKSLTAKVTLPILGVGAAAAKIGMEFEKSMSEVSAVTGATGEEFKNLEKLAREMGAKTSKSAKDAADAIKYMGLAGWDTGQIMKGLEPVLRLSEAGNIDLGRASDLVTDSMSALGLSVEELGTYLDQMAQTSRKSNTNIDMLAEAMIVVGGTFKNLNTPLDEANALLGILANRGKKGSEAGTALNSILINLTSGAGQAGKAMKELGLSAFDSQGNFKGISNVLKELREKLSGMTEEQRNTYLAMIGGKTQIDTLNALLDGVGKEYDELRENIQDSNGALSDMAKTMQDNNLGALTRLKSALEEAALSIYDTLKPSIEAIIAKIQEWTDWFNNLSPEMKELIVKIGLIAAAIGPLLIVIAKAITIFGKLKAAAAILGPIIGGISAPVLITAGVITGLIAIGVLLYKNWDTIKEKALEFKDKLIETFNKIKQSISRIIGSLKENILGIWNGIISGIKGSINKIISIINIFTGGMNKIGFKIPSWVPGLGGKSFGFNIPQIPMLASGGIVKRPTLAMLGEAGPEAVVPLDKGLGSGNYVSVTITGNTIFSDNIDYIGERIVERLKLAGVV